jgi:uncharacterized protein (DUF362 family)
MSTEHGRPWDEPRRGERFFGERAMAPQRRYSGRSATVAIARTTERHRDAESITALTRRAIDLLGGITSFVSPGQRVLIKPNCTGYFLADEGITTDPRLVAALVRLCFQGGASTVTVGESAGMEETGKVLHATGMAAAARAAGARVVAFDECELREVDVPHGRAIRRIALPVPLLEADVVINACKGKTHHMDPVSGAIKNWVGAIPLALRMRHHDVHAFTEYVDIMSVMPPALHICDAIVVGEGDGPLANTPRWCGCVLASADPAALDVTLCRLFSLDSDEHKFAAEAAERGLGTNDPECITVVGDTLEEARIEVRRPRRGWDYYPFNVIVGGGVTYAGTLGHWKSIADAFLRDGTWVRTMAVRGVPTFLIGDADDPDFERHVSQGPYFVIDDVAPARYRLDPRVHVIPGHPALHNMLPELLRGLGLSVPGRVTQRVQQWARLAESRLLYVPRAQTMREATRAAAVLGGVGILALGAIRLLRRCRQPVSRSL